METDNASQYCHRRDADQRGGLSSLPHISERSAWRLSRSHMRMYWPSILSSFLKAIPVNEERIARRSLRFLPKYGRVLRICFCVDRGCVSTQRATVEVLEAHQNLARGRESPGEEYVVDLQQQIQALRESLNVQTKLAESFQVPRCTQASLHTHEFKRQYSYLQTRMHTHILLRSVPPVCLSLPLFLPLCMHVAYIETC